MFVRLNECGVWWWRNGICRRRYGNPGNALAVVQWWPPGHPFHILELPSGREQEAVILLNKHTSTRATGAAREQKPGGTIDKILKQARSATKRIKALKKS